MYTFSKLLKQNVPWKRVVLGCWQLALSFFGPLVNRTISSSHFSLTSRGTMSGCCQKRGAKKRLPLLANSNSLDFNIIFQSLTIGKLRVKAIENKCHWWPPDLLFSEDSKWSHHPKSWCFSTANQFSLISLHVFLVMAFFWLFCCWAWFWVNSCYDYLLCLNFWCHVFLPASFT